jgi:hypothetical protein
MDYQERYLCTLDALGGQLCVWHRWSRCAVRSAEVLVSPISFLQMSDAYSDLVIKSQSPKRKYRSDIVPQSNGTREKRDRTSKGPRPKPIPRSPVSMYKTVEPDAGPHVTAIRVRELIALVLRSNPTARMNWLRD